MKELMERFNEIVARIENLEIAQWSEEELHIVINAALAGNRKAAKVIYNKYDDDASPFLYDNETLFWERRNFTEKEKHDIRIVFELAEQYEEEEYAMEKMRHEMVQKEVQERQQFLKKLMDYVMQTNDIDDSHMKELVSGNEKHMSKMFVRQAFYDWVDKNLFPQMTRKMEKYTPANEKWETDDLPF